MAVGHVDASGEGYMSMYNYRGVSELPPDVDDGIDLDARLDLA